MKNTYDPGWNLGDEFRHIQALNAWKWGRVPGWNHGKGGITRRKLKNLARDCFRQFRRASS